MGFTLFQALARPIKCRGRCGLDPIQTSGCGLDL